jgi:hypothetical protein
LMAMYHDAKRDHTRTISSVGSHGEARADPPACNRQQEISPDTSPDRLNCTKKNRHSASAPVSPHWYAPCLRLPGAEKLEKARTKDELTYSVKLALRNRCPSRWKMRLIPCTPHWIPPPPPSVSEGCRVRMYRAHMPENMCNMRPVRNMCISSSLHC